MIDAAIVGLGWWGQVLADAVHGKSDRIRFVRGVTRTPGKVEAFAQRTGIPIGDDYAAVLADPAIDAVALATPHSQHTEQIVAAAAAGKHIFAEKPLALTVAEARKAIEACRAAGVVLAVGQNRRFLPAVQRLAELVRDSTLGQPMHVDGCFSGPTAARRPPGSWRLSPSESPAGGMAGRGVHVTDLMIHLFGPVEQVDARSYRQVVEGDLDDTTAMLLRFASGMTGYLLTITATAELWRLQVYGSKGWAEMRGFDRLVVSLIGEEESVEEFPQTDIERAELEAFADAVEGKAPYPVLAEEVLANIALFECVPRSAKQGRACDIAEVLDLDSFWT